MRTTKPYAAGSTHMDAEERGAQIKQRRLQLGIANINQFYARTKATRDEDGNKLDRNTLAKVERGTAISSKIDEVEHWLEREETRRRTGSPLTVVEPEPEPEEREPIRIELHGIHGTRFDVDDIIATAPVEYPDQLAEAVSKIIDSIERGTRDERED